MKVCCSAKCRTQKQKNSLRYCTLRQIYEYVQYAAFVVALASAVFRKMLESHLQTDEKCNYGECERKTKHRQCK